MSTEIETIRTLASAEDDIAALEHTLRRLDLDDQANNAVLAASTARVQTVVDQLQTLRRAQAADNTALESAEKNKARALRALEQGLGNPDTAQHQLDAASTDISALETAILERMDAIDDAIAHHTEIADEHAAVSATASEKRDAIDARRADTNQLLQAARRVADDAVATLPSDLQAQIRALRAKRGRATARIQSDACTACRQVAPRQTASDIASGRTLGTCGGCGRILVAP